MPVVSPCGRFVAYSAPKTGSTWVRDAWVKNGGRFFGRGHDPLRDPAGDARTVATIRDPWSWYASWYAHALRARDDALHRRGLAFFGQGSYAFKDVLRGATRFAPLTLAVFWAPRAQRPRLSAEEADALYSVVMSYCYEAEPDYWLATDRLAEGLEELTPGLVLPPPANVSPDAPEELDAEMVEWIARAEVDWIARIGWSGPGEPTPWAVRRGR